MKIWYAIMMDTEDTDWGTGSYDKAEALAKAAELRADGYDEAYVAVIEESENDAVCVEEIHEI